MADADAQPDVEVHDEPPLSPREHLNVIHDHLHSAMDAMDGAEPHADPPDADDGARGMARFSQLSATKRAGFPAGSGAQRSLDALRGRR